MRGLKRGAGERRELCELPYSEELLPDYKAMGLPIRVRLACRAFPSMEEACGALRQLSKLGLPGAIEDVSALSPSEARRILDLFLHDPDMAMPIEPFATILSGMIRRRRIGLWDLLGPPSRSDGRAADEFLFHIPQDHPECLSCRCFFACEAYGAWAGACETWREIITELAGAARELSRV